MPTRDGPGAASAARALCRAVRAAGRHGVLFLALASSPAVGAARDPMLSRDLHCARFELPRSQEICRALEREMEWTWMGHAVLWPGYRVTWATLKRVYCGAHVEPRDTAALVALVVWYGKGEQNDWRLESGATYLLKLMGKSALAALPAAGSMSSEMSNVQLKHLEKDLVLTSSDEKSIFHPSNVRHIMGDGCPN